MFCKRKDWTQAESTGLKLTLNSLFWWGGTCGKKHEQRYITFFVLPGALQSHLCKLSGLSGYTVQTYFYYSQNYLSFPHMLCTSFNFQFVFCFDLQLRFCFRVFLLFLLLILFLVVFIIIFIFCFVCVICVIIHIFKGPVQFRTLFNNVY